MNDEHTYVDQELLPGYALDALDDAEREQVARHLERCPPCRDTAADDRAAVDQIGFALPPRRPPARLKAQVIGQIVLQGAGAAEAPSERRAGPRYVPTWLVAAAILPWAVVAALGMEMMVMAGHAPTPELNVANLSGRHGAMGELTMMKDSPTAALALAHLPALPPHMMYVCWLGHAGTMEPIKAFRTRRNGDAAFVRLRATHPLRDYHTIGVSMEATPHPRRPTGTFLATATF